MPLAPIMIDVDYFKCYNDHYGRQVGDGYLSFVAQVLKMAVRVEGDSVARYGGEEFVMTPPGVSLTRATIIAERTRQEIHDAALSYEASTVTVVVTASTGVVASDSTVPMETLIARTDNASYQVRSKGRNQ